MDDGKCNYFGRQLIRDYYFGNMPIDLKSNFKDKFDLEPEL